MTPEQWTQATPDQRVAHAARFGPPPAGYGTATLPPQLIPAAAPQKKSRKALTITLACVVAVLVVVGIATAGRATAPPPAPAQSAAPTTTAVSAPPTVEDDFVSDILDTPGLTTDMARDEMISIGKKACEAMPAVKDHAAFVAAMGVTKFGPEVSEVFISSAEKHLCPYAIYGSELPAPVTAPAPAVTAGPLAAVSPGTYEVGTGAGQVAPGKYRSAAPDGSNGVGCYYARLRHNDGSLDDIISNNISQGQSLVTIKASDGYLEVSGCTFTRI